MTNPLITEFLPTLRGHVIYNYRWMERRGNCLLTLDDIIQIASITLVKLADEWDSIREEQGLEHSNGLFYTILKHRVKHDVLKYYVRVGKGDEEQPWSLDKSADDGRSDADGLSLSELEMARTSIRVRENAVHWLAINDTIIAFYETLPTKDKVFLAIRYFDEVPTHTAASILELGRSTYSTQVSNIVARWRQFTRNQFTDHPSEVSKRVEYEWTPPETLLTYLRDRHRKDLHEYLWYVTTCMRQDVSYLVDILGTGRAYSPDTVGGRSTITPAQAREIDHMLGQGFKMTEIAKQLGVAYSAVTWRKQRRVGAAA